ncbi:MAG: hypothetical protein GY930_11045 [bacterium]|nr:hypothetical protein [bacterium]
MALWYLAESRWQKDVAKRAKECPGYQTKASPSFEDMLKAAQMALIPGRVWRSFGMLVDAWGSRTAIVTKMKSLENPSSSKGA